jgi:membrane-anchored protein YejM (alkaline phosphatase superfamily)
VEQPLNTLLAGWDSFYVIAGSVAGALIGLQFVVIALIADSRRRTTRLEIAAFGTPTVLHFCAALLVSALLSVPWTSPSGLRFTLVACGIAGVLYAVIIIRRALRPHRYRPQLEDWVWHAALPLLAYLTLGVAAVLLRRHSASALSLIAAVTLGLVFIGIHNSWDTITYVAIDPERGSVEAGRSEHRKHQ